MKLKLEINGEMKEFKSKKMRGRAMKRMLEVSDILGASAENNTFDVRCLDVMAEFICEIFNNEFDMDQLYDGIALEELYPAYNKIMEEIGNKTAAKMENVIKN